jgi:hypothetical protein
MSRTLRFQHPGTVYDLMARGDGGKMVFENETGGYMAIV